MTCNQLTTRWNLFVLWILRIVILATPLFTNKLKYLWKMNSNQHRLDNETSPNMDWIGFLHKFTSHQSKTQHKAPLATCVCISLPCRAYIYIPSNLWLVATTASHLVCIILNFQKIYTIASRISATFIVGCQ